MGASTTKNENKIRCEGGWTYVDCANVCARYKYRLWIFQLNPRLKLPSRRKDHRKIIVVNGRRQGWAEIRGGLIPLSRYMIHPNVPGASFLNFLRKHFGYQLKYYEKGYMLISIRSRKYIVTHRVTSNGITVCEIFSKASEYQVATVLFNEDFSEVYPHMDDMRYADLVFVIIGYIADSLIYSRAASMLRTNIKIVI